MPYYGDGLPYYYGGAFSNHSSLMTGTGRTLHSPLGSRYAPHLTTISESPLSALRRYTPASTMTTLRPKRIIDTADIDVSTPRALSSSTSSNSTNNQRNNRLRRDRPTIRIRSQALKDNPALREHNERHEKTVGELLVEKFLIKDKKPESGDGSSSSSSVNDLQTKLYSQISLGQELTKKQREELHEAIQRKVTRRLTRRRSSADVSVDPLHIEREMILAQAQADALDSLVAEEQKEIEVETRMGTLIRKNLVRTSMGPTTTFYESNRGISDEENDSETRDRKPATAKKVKKRKKTEKPSPPREIDFDKGSRSKEVTPAEIGNESAFFNEKPSNVIGEQDKKEIPAEGEEEKEDIDSQTPTKGLKFKIEASNSVGDFSTLLINAGRPGSLEKPEPEVPDTEVEDERPRKKRSQDKLTEQFRDSVRLPAPPRLLGVDKIGKPARIVEEHQQVVVLPVKKRYVKDDTRNSVYLTLKAPRNVDKMAEIGETSSTTAEGAAVDDRRTGAKFNGKSLENDRPKISTASAGDTTTGEAKRHPRSNKLAKFRSKDIAESDAEVKSISESKREDENGAKARGTKEARLIDVCDDLNYRSIDNEKSISVPLNGDVLSSIATVIEDPPAKDRIFEKNLIQEIRPTEEDSHLKSLEAETSIDSSLIKPKTLNSSDKIFAALTKNGVAGVEENDDVLIGGKSVTVSEDEKGAEKSSKISAPTTDKKNRLKEVLKDNKDISEDNNRKNIKKKLLLEKKSDKTIFPESPSTKVHIDHALGKFEASKKKEEQKECLVVGADGDIEVRTSSFVKPREKIVASLPNASTINPTNVANGLKEAANLKEAKFDAAPRAQGKIGAEDLREVGIAGKFSESKSGDYSRTAENEVNGLGIVNRVESSEKRERNIKDLSIVKDIHEDNKVNDKSTKDHENAVADSPKLRKYRKPVSAGANTKSLESPPESPNLEVQPKKILKLRRNTSDPRGDLVKDPKFKKGPEDPEKSADNSSSEKSKLANGVKKEIPASKGLPKQEESISSDIDFWGEIASDKDIAKPGEKFGAKIHPQKSASLEEEREKDIGKSDDPMVIVLEPKVKSDIPGEILTRDESKAGPDKKLIKAKQQQKKKKVAKEETIERRVEDAVVGRKKKDHEEEKEEETSEKTIFERSSDAFADEKTRQQPAERLEQRPGCDLPEENSSQVPEKEEPFEPVDIDRYERNLSTILEENLSPIREDTPRITGKDAIDPVTSALEGAKSPVAKLENLQENLEPKKFEPPSAISPISAEKIHEVATSGSGHQEEVPDSPSIKTAPKRDLPTPIHISHAPLPTIAIFEPPVTPIAKEFPPEVPEAIEEVDEQNIDEEDPDTPTNEISNFKSAANITKWENRVDLSLDEPADKDTKPEVSPARESQETAGKKEKKKVGSSTKKTSKKSSVKAGEKNAAAAGSTDSSKKKKLVKRKKSLANKSKDGAQTNDERSGSKISNSSDTTLKPSDFLKSRYSPKNSDKGSANKPRPLDLIKMFYTTPASLLTATPRDLSKVRRAKVKKRKHSTRTASASSDSTGSTRSTATTESTGSNEHDDETEQKRISSTRSNDSGFDGSPRLSNCDMACHKKCEKLTGNLCGLNQKLVAEALQALKRAPSQSSDNQRNSDGSDHHPSGRITPPATNLPRFKKYTVMDFNFLKVLGKGSFGKVLLAELRQTDCVYAVKCLHKQVVLEDDDVECTLIERKVLTLATRHPYLCHLFCTFQTNSHLFFVMEYLNGGDLMFHIQNSGRFAESRARFYAAEVWSGLNFLHKKGIVYRDLKLDNVLLDFEGHIRIADFGMCKLQIFLDRTADTFCGTPDYMAPEIIKGLKYNQAVDWWSFGVLLYEMLTGSTPFSGCDEDELFWSICNERPFIPRYLSQEAMDFLVCLLEKDAGKRPVAHEIAIHPFFHAMAWDRLEKRQLEPPFKPALEHTLDTRYFDTAFTTERPRLTPVSEQVLSSMDQGVFRGFSYTNPNATD